MIEGAMTEEELVEELADDIAEVAVSERHNQGMHAFVAKAAYDKIKAILPIVTRAERERCIKIADAVAERIDMTSGGEDDDPGCWDRIDGASQVAAALRTEGDTDG